VTSSRALERSCINDVACRYLAANQAPDFRSIARFGRRHLKALIGLFTQVLAGCAMAGLVHLGQVALDGTKLRALMGGAEMRDRAPHLCRSVPRDGRGG